MMIRPKLRKMPDKRAVLFFVGHLSSFSTVHRTLQLQHHENSKSNLIEILTIIVSMLHYTQELNTISTVWQLRIRLCSLGRSQTKLSARKCKDTQQYKYFLLSFLGLCLIVLLCFQDSQNKYYDIRIFFLLFFFILICQLRVFLISLYFLS